LALAEAEPPAGRGRPSLRAIGAASFTLIDESYNANPASVGAAIENLARLQPGKRGRRIAVLGDMRELGPAGIDLHRGLAPLIEAAKVDLVFAAGPLMRELYDLLPPARRGAYAATSAELEPFVLEALRAGDVVMVKGSLGSKMGPIVKAIEKKHAPDIQARVNAA
jgi:UDP-N-acetylmuramoyl-tripeptide--D-alanyl-D-alanine ligase